MTNDEKEMPLSEDSVHPVTKATRVGSEETRERILEAALVLFARNGFNATTTKAIAQQAQVPAGLLFYYFPNKKALLQSLIAEWAKAEHVKLRTMLKEEITKNADIHSTIMQMGIILLKFLQQHKDLLLIFLREFPSHPEVEAGFRELRENVFRIFMSYFSEAVQAGKLKEVNVYVLARMFSYDIVMVTLIDDRPDAVQFVKDSVDLLLRGLVPENEE